jgi:hypothetical protein
MVGRGPASRGLQHGLGVFPNRSAAVGQQRPLGGGVSSGGLDPGQPRQDATPGRSRQWGAPAGGASDGDRRRGGHQWLAGLGGSGELAALLLGVLGFPALSRHSGGPAPGGPAARGGHGARGRHRSGPALVWLERPSAGPWGRDHLAPQGRWQSKRPPGRPLRLRQHCRELVGPGLALHPGGSGGPGPQSVVAGHRSGPGLSGGDRDPPHRFPQRLGRFCVGAAFGAGGLELGLAAASAAGGFGDRQCRHPQRCA